MTDALGGPDGLAEPITVQSFHQSRRRQRFAYVGLVAAAGVAFSFVVGSQSQHSRDIARIQRAEEAACTDRQEAWELRREMIVAFTAHAVTDDRIAVRYELTVRERRVSDAALAARNDRFDQTRRELLAGNGTMPECRSVKGNL